MKIYQVGGSVRDELLGLDASDKDYVVVGSTAAEMVAAGYKPVGKDFPVFLHPVTHEEYALARTERKQSVGYGGFSFFADPTVSLEEDLTRRDLTVNAIAKDEQGVLIDPHGGLADLEARIFRHVSPAFAEDPLRVIRLARFLARFPDFSVADETLDLVKKVIASGEIAHLTQERLWQEWRQGLMTGRPDRMIRFLTDVDALDVALGVPTPRSVRSQRLDEMLDVLMAAVADRKPVPLRLLILFFVDDETEPIGPTLLRLPKEIVELARLFSSTDQAVTALFDRSPKSMQRLLRRADPQRRPERFSQWLSLIEDYDRYRPRLANRKATLSTLSEAAGRIVALDRSAYHGLSAAEIVARRERAETEICAEALADHAEREAGPPEELERHGL